MAGVGLHLMEQSKRDYLRLESQGRKSLWMTVKKKLKKLSRSI